MTRSSTVRALGLALTAAALLGLTGCMGLIVGAGATAGVAAYSERGIDGAAVDMKIHGAISTAFFEADEMLPIDIGVEVYDGRVLLSGVARDEKMRADAVRLTWATTGVNEVYNEIQLAGGGTVNLAKDSWITTQLKTTITFDKQIMAVNYSVETVNGTIYLIGLAQSHEELDRVVAHAREVDYVKNVISHVAVKGAG